MEINLDRKIKEIISGGEREREGGREGGRERERGRERMALE